MCSPSYNVSQTYTVDRLLTSILQLFIYSKGSLIWVLGDVEDEELPESLPLCD